MASLDNLWVTVVVFGGALAFLIILTIWPIITTGAADIFDATPQGQEIEANAQTVMDNVDFYFVMIFFALHLGILILAFFLRSHPIVYVAGILVIAVLALVAAPLSNFYDDLGNQEEFASADAQLSMTDFLMTNLPKVEIVFGFITIVILTGLAKVEGFL
jgi:hypothetical protein